MVQNLFAQRKYLCTGNKIDPYKICLSNSKAFFDSKVDE